MSLKLHHPATRDAQDVVPVKPHRCPPDGPDAGLASRPAAAQCLHLRRPPRVQGLSRRVPARLPAPRRVPADLPRRRHHRRLEPDALASTGRRRTTTSSARSSARPSTARASSMSRATTTGRSATTTDSCWATSRSGSRPCTRPRMAVASWSCTATSSTASCVPARCSSRSAARAYAAVLRLNRYVNAVRQPLGFPYWSVSRVPQAQGQERGEIHRQLRARARRRSPPPRRGRRDLRPHPSRRDQRDRRHHLLQRRRLGRELHGPRRGLPGPAEPAALDRDRRGAGRARSRCRCSTARPALEPAA